MDAEPKKGFFTGGEFSLLIPYFQDVVAKMQAQMVKEQREKDKKEGNQAAGAATPKSVSGSEKPDPNDPLLLVCVQG